MGQTRCLTQRVEVQAKTAPGCTRQSRRAVAEDNGFANADVADAAATFNFHLGAQG